MYPIILLHGALGASTQLEALKSALNENFKNVYSFDFIGHAGRDFPAEGFDIPSLAHDILLQMENNGIEKAQFFGYSLGGYVALWMAMHFPEKVERVFTHATKFDWSIETAAHEIKMLNPEKIEAKVPAFANSLKERHAPQDWKKLMHFTANFMEKLGANPALKKIDFEQIKQGTMLSVGDKDQMVSMEETLTTYKLLTNANIAVIPFTQHPIEKLNIAFMLPILNSFFIA